MKFGWLAILGLLWSARLSAMKAAATSGIPAYITVVISVAGIAAVFSAISLSRRSYPPLSFVAMRFYLLSGVLGFILPFIAENLVSPHLQVFVFTTIIATMPIITLVLGAASGAEKLGLRQIAGIGLGFVVAVLIATDTSGKGGLGDFNIKWVVMGFGVPLLYAINTIFVASRWPPGVDAIQVVNAQALVVSFAILAGAVVKGGDWQWSTALLNPWAILGIVLFEALGLLVYLRIARDHGASFVSQANYISMVFSAALGFFFFGDRLTWLTAFAGFLLVVALRAGRPFNGTNN